MERFNASVFFEIPIPTEVDIVDFKANSYLGRNFRHLPCGSLDKIEIKRSIV